MLYPTELQAQHREVEKVLSLVQAKSEWTVQEKILPTYCYLEQRSLLIVFIHGQETFIFPDMAVDHCSVARVECGAFSR